MKQMENINEIKMQFFEKMRKFDKFLVRLTKKKKEKIRISI